MSLPAWFDGKCELDNLLDSFKDFSMSNFIYYLLDDNSPYFKGFWDAPGSSISKDGSKKHHAYKGGLAYHMITAAKLGASIVDHYHSIGYKDISKDLVAAGILIHDIGKVGAYLLQEDGSIKKTDRERLFHHIPWGFAEIKNAIEEYNKIALRKVSDETRDKLLHIILSHHGRKSWSSPVIPQFTEAYIVHMVEFMDGMVEKYVEGRVPETIYD